MLIEEAIIEHWGPRCPDFNPECPICRAWREFDNAQSQIETLAHDLAELQKERDELQTEVYAWRAKHPIMHYAPDLGYFVFGG